MAIAITLQTIIELVYPMLNSYMIDTFFEKQDYTYYYWFIAAYVGVAICTGLFGIHLFCGESSRVNYLRNSQ